LVFFCFLFFFRMKQCHPEGHVLSIVQDVNFVRK
jgi:hypothetical protein